MSNSEMYASFIKAIYIMLETCMKYCFWLGVNYKDIGQKL